MQRFNQQSEQPESEYTTMTLSNHKARFYRPELDVLRFCCFMLVFLHHALPRASDSVASALVDAGAFGVPVFFLLSSFLITELLIQEKERMSSINLGAFYARRILRIWPLYFAFFAFCWLLGHLHWLVTMQPIPTKMTLFYLLLAGNWYLVFFGIPANAVNILWSISIEEQFYLLWPWLLRWRGHHLIRTGSATVIVVSYATLFLLARSNSPADSSIWTNTLVQMQFFAIGGLLALYLRRHRAAFSITSRLAFVTTAFFAWFTAAYFCRLKRADLSISVVHACLGYALVAIGAICIFLAFYGAPVSKNTYTRFAIYLGRISFGLYTFHYFAIGLALGFVHRVAPRSSPIVPSLLLGLAITVMLAASSYHWLESPMLRLKTRFTLVRSRPV